MSKHYLVVPERWDPDNDEMYVEHPPECPTYPTVWDGVGYECQVGMEASEGGLYSFFVHRDSDDPDHSSYTERVAPGRHEIEPWVERYHGPWGTEYDAGLRTVET